jgi:hypothetical protein
MEESLKIKKASLYNFLLFTTVFVSFFDSHIEKIVAIKRLPLPEVLLLSIAVVFLIKNSFNNLKTITINVLIVILFLFGLLSGIVNKNPLLTTFLGVIWVFKSLVALYVGYNLAFNDKQRNSVLRLLYKISLLTALFTGIQILYGPLNPFFNGVFNPFGFVLTSSGLNGFMDNPNKNGFMLLFGFLYVLISKVKYGRLLAAIFIIEIFFVQSRQIIIVLVLILLYYFITIRKNHVQVLVIFLGLVMGVLLFKDSLFHRFAHEIPRILDTGNYFRVKALKIGFDVLKDNMLVGSGPGTFGGIVAHLTNSPVHENYNLFEHWSAYKNLDIVPVTIDMYWPHLFVEIGVIGMVIFMALYIKIHEKLKERSNESSNFIRILFIVVCVMGFFSMSLESSYLVYPIFILIGIEIKCIKNERKVIPR